MISLQKKSYIYFDLDILKDDELSLICKELAKQHVQMFVCIPVDVQKEEVIKMKNYRYMNDILQGRNIEDMILKSCCEKKQKLQHVCVLTKHEHVIENLQMIDVLSIFSIGYHSLQEHLQQREKRYRKKKVILHTITLSCILFYILYFMLLSWLPVYLIDGEYVHIIRSLPAIALLISIILGIRCKIYHPKTIVEIFDVFG